MTQTATPADPYAVLPESFPEFRNFHAGKSILVCGCGKSLRLLGDPEQFITIGVNDIGRMFHPDYLVVLNNSAQFAGDRFDYVAASQAKAFFTHLNLPIDHPHIVRFRLGAKGGTEPTDKTLPHTRNSPYLAANLARFMGAKRIGLIGVDFTFNHFFGATGRHPLDRETRQISQEFGAFRDSCARDGIEVVNLSPYSRITELPYEPIGEFSANAKSERSKRIVSYAITPKVGVPQILTDCINDRTAAQATTVQGRDRYASGLRFGADLLWSKGNKDVERHLSEADVVIVHDGKVEPQHRAVLQDKPIITMAHSVMWNVDTQFVNAGMPGVVVAQYAAGQPEYAHWGVVPNPIPLWNDAYRPDEKNEKITIVYTPADQRDVYPASDRMFSFSKGYRETLNILNRVATRHDNINLIVRQARPMTHHEVLLAKRSAHIVIDECVTGGYHRNSLEGLATGCVVINGVGLRPEIMEAFQRGCSESASLPFETASMETLENVLNDLIALGGEALIEKGCQNRTWMERFWNFDDQWRRFWVPAIDDALKQVGQHSAQVVQRSTQWIGLDGDQIGKTSFEASPRNKPIGDITVIIPFGQPDQEPDRLKLLAKSIDCALVFEGSPKIIVVEASSAAKALALCAEKGVSHVFLRSENGPFHKTRALNHGASVADTSHVLFLDADLLAPKTFAMDALVEAESRRLDCLIPWRSISYLSEDDTCAVLNGERDASDCTPIMHTTSAGSNRAGAMVVRKEFIDQYGGMIEQFRGWGGEDNAFFAKVECLGKAGISRSLTIHLHHLHHPNSATERSAAAQANPHYETNVELLGKVRSLRNRVQFLEAFPAPQPS